MNTIDLQVHSTASDGRHAPEEVVRMAKESGVNTIALTDHDTIKGLEAALRGGEVEDVKVIPGIEISVEDHGAHILGYGIDWKNPELLASLEQSEQDRIKSAKKTLENLKQLGFVVEWEDVLRETTGSVIGRPHISRAVLHRPENKAKLGSISTVGDFIQSYLLEDSPHYNKRRHTNFSEAIKLIHGAGGVVVWSHPVLHFRNNYDGLEKFLGELCEMGLDGLEVFTSAHSEDEAEFVQNLAIAKNLLRTAGSDFHEANSATAKIGGYETYGFSTEDIMPKLEEAISKRKSALYT